MRLLRSFREECGVIRAALAVVVLVLGLTLAVVAYLSYTQGRSFTDTFRAVKESSLDAARTAKVRTALALSKYVSAFDIKVETRQGEVTLAGQVPSDEAKAVAEAIAKDTSGVDRVRNALVVNPTAARNAETDRLAERVADLEIKTLLTEALGRDPELKRIDAQIQKRGVTLSGTVDTPTQKYAAIQLAWQTPGVLGVTDSLTVTNIQATPESADDKLARRVEFELYSTKALPLKRIQIRSKDATVTLSGSVASRAERLLAEKIAERVEGARKVINNLAAPDEGER
jgi:hyperosmotically inducible protein